MRIELFCNLPCNTPFVFSGVEYCKVSQTEALSPKQLRKRVQFNPRTVIETNWRPPTVALARAA